MSTSDPLAIPFGGVRLPTNTENFRMVRASNGLHT